jgi:hypothetical protein
MELGGDEAKIKASGRADAFDRGPHSLVVTVE